MNKLYSALLLTLTTVAASAQISLDETMAPAVNTMYIYYDANTPNPAFTFSKSGTTNTWDFSALTPSAGDEDTVYFLAPSDLQNGNAFTTATHATYEAGDDSYTMIQIDATAITYLGVLTDPFASGMLMPLMANPPAQVMTFPYTYGSTANVNSYFDIYTTGATIGQPAIDSVHYRSYNISTNEVIASGDLILPSGTTAALLERQVHEAVDSAWTKSAAMGNVWLQAPGFPTSSTDSAFYWYNDQSLQHMAHALFDETGTMHDVHYYQSTQVTTGVKEAEKKQINVFPNPTTAFLGVQGLNFPASSKWNIVNTSGQLILSGDFSLNSINVQNLKQGEYILHVTSPAGENQTVRFIKH